MNDYDLYYTDKLTLRLDENKSFKYLIKTDNIQRTLKVMDADNKTVCKAIMKGWFFWKKLECNLNSEKKFVINKREVISSGFNIKFDPSWGFIYINNEKIPIKGYFEYRKLNWRCVLSADELILLICFILRSSVLDDSRKYFQEMSLANKE